MAANSNFEPDWSTLPIGPLTSVAKRLPTRVDVLRYRAVCRNFRSSTTLSTQPRYPYPNLKIPATFLTDPDPGHLILKHSSFYAIEQVRKPSKTQRKTKTKTWVLRVEELGYGLIFVKKPFCGDHYRNMHKKLPDCLNLLDYRVKEMGKIYDLEFIPNKESFYDTKVRCGKVVVSDDVSSVMTTLRGGRLAVWRNGDENWTEIDVGIGGGFGVCYEDLVFHKGKFYAVHTENLLISIDPKSLVHTEIGYLDLPFRHCKYFVKWSNDLFLVVKCFGSDYDEKLFGGRRRKNNDYSAENYPIGFLILKFEEEGHGLFPAGNAFKDGVVFLGDDFSFCVSSMEFPGLRRNCVYLCDGVFGNPDDLNFDGEDDVHPGLSVGVYDLEKNTARPLSAFPDNIFWPPPTFFFFLNKAFCFNYSSGKSYRIEFIRKDGQSSIQIQGDERPSPLLASKCAEQFPSRLTWLTEIDLHLRASSIMSSTTIPTAFRDLSPPFTRLTTEMLSDSKIRSKKPISSANRSPSSRAIASASLTEYEIRLGQEEAASTWPS